MAELDQWVGKSTGSLLIPLKREKYPWKHVFSRLWRKEEYMNLYDSGFFSLLHKTGRLKLAILRIKKELRSVPVL
jgi:hypothetical protein